MGCIRIQYSWSLRSISEAQNLGVQLGIFDLTPLPPTPGHGIRSHYPLGISCSLGPAQLSFKQLGSAGLAAWAKPTTSLGVPKGLRLSGCGFSSCMHEAEKKLDLDIWPP